MIHPLPFDGQICKDKDEAEVWFAGFKALITRGNYRKRRSESQCDIISSDSPHARAHRNSPSIAPFVSSSDFFVFSFYKALIAN